MNHIHDSGCERKKRNSFQEFIIQTLCSPTGTGNNKTMEPWIASSKRSMKRLNPKQFNHVCVKEERCASNSQNLKHYFLSKWTALIVVMILPPAYTGCSLQPGNRACPPSCMGFLSVLPSSYLSPPSFTHLPLIPHAVCAVFHSVVVQAPPELVNCGGDSTVCEAAGLIALSRSVAGNVAVQGDAIWPMSCPQNLPSAGITQLLSV